MRERIVAFDYLRALCSTLNLVILTINFDFNIICVQCNVIRNFIHIIPTPIIRSHRGLTNVQAISKAYSTEKSLLPYHVKVVYQYR